MRGAGGRLDAGPAAPRERGVRPGGGGGEAAPDRRVSGAFEWHGPGGRGGLKKPCVSAFHVLKSNPPAFRDASAAILVRPRADASPLAPACWLDCCISLPCGREHYFLI
jgi:hypothetical protein